MFEPAGRATWALASLGFLNGAGNGIGSGLSHRELVRVFVIEFAAIFLSQTKALVNNLLRAVVDRSGGSASDTIPFYDQSVAPYHSYAPESS